MDNKSRGYAAIGLDNPKCHMNVGGVLRAAGCYGAALVVMSGQRFKRWPTDTRKQWRHMPLIECDNLERQIPYSCVPVAVDLMPGATPLYKFTHPERAFYIFGAEDATLGDRILSWCKHTVYIPTDGCMNLAATVNVVLYDRAMKSAKLI